MPISERPRERLLKLGAEALSSQEVLALLLGRGTKGESVMVTAQKLISQFGNLKNLASASIEELTKITGIGTAKAAQIKAAFELSRRLEEPPDRAPKITVKSPEDILKSVRSLLKGKRKEHFLVLSLDTRNHLIDMHKVSIGSLDCSIVHPREAFKEAIADSAASVIFVHNHPSGDPTPSADDIQLTKRLTDAGQILGIEVLDHVIVCDEDYLSMKAKNLF
ncbi:MAG TPA: JAB domain-containing protein [Dehalococcoidia bacterium]|nr:JAB domain-containing protein [Dehalococcoidia bacterium]